MSEHDPLPVERVSMNIVMAVSVGLFLIGSTAIATWQLFSIYAAIEGLRADLKSESERVSDRVARLEREMAFRMADRWTAADHDLWCAITEKVNAKSGWRCGTLNQKRALPSAPPRSNYYYPGQPETDNMGQG